jgi:hypothetical protein
MTEVCRLDAAEEQAHARPLRSESGQIADRLGRSALCQSRLNAPQQKVPLFDHLVGAGEQLRWRDQGALHLRVDIWDQTGNSIVEQVAGVDDAAAGPCRPVGRGVPLTRRRPVHVNQPGLPPSSMP